MLAECAYLCCGAEVPARQEAADTVECCVRERTVSCGWAVGYESATRKHTLGEVLTAVPHLFLQNSAATTERQ